MSSESLHVINENELKNQQEAFYCGSLFLTIHPFILNFSVASLYFLLARMSLILQFEQSQATPVWPPSGLAVAAVMLFGNRVLTGIFLGAFSANFLDFYLKSATEFSEFMAQALLPFCESVVIATGNAGEAFIFLFLYKYVLETINFGSTRSVVVLIILTPVATLVSSTVGATSLLLTGYIPTELMFAVWFTWWMGDTTGIYLFLPLILSMVIHRRILKTQFMNLQSLLALGMSFLIAILTFFQLFNIVFFTAQAYLLLPLLLIFIFRLPLNVVLCALLIISVVAVLGTIAGMGPFYRAEQNVSLILLQGFISVAVITILLVHSILIERNISGRELAKANIALAQANKLLEHRVRERTAELENVNLELARSNQELDDFAYIASHDLKEPLRGIENNIHFMLEDLAHEITPAIAERINRLPVITKHLETLINSLLHFSRVGRIDLALNTHNLQTIVEEVIDSIAERLTELNVVVTFKAPLPKVYCDKVRIAEVYRNLITNGIKYNDKENKTLELGVLDSSPTVFYVKDNGIGIKERHQSRIFQIFKRLHGKDKYGGGTGAGMTIVKKIIERHDGKIWLDSAVGVGTTFFFTLAAEQGHHHE